MLGNLKDKKILILGFGREGKDALCFLRKIFPEKIFGIADKSEKIKITDKKTRLYLGKNYLKCLKKYDTVIKSPGIPFTALPKSALKKIITQTEIFFDNCPGKIIGVTGTKGKSTTSSLIYKILKKGGIKAHLLGNIGKPALNLLFSATSKDVYVYEMSSFQLANLRKSPYVAVFLNIYPEHLDYHRNLKEYVKAKANITKYQKEKDFLIYNPENKLVKKIAGKSKAIKVPIKSFPKSYLKKKEIPLKGKFNLQNMAAAIETVKIFGIPKKKIIEGLKNFKPLAHRLEYVGTYKGIKFYNDALSTIPETTIAALDSMEGKVETIFLGGFDRGLDFKNLVKRILKDKIKNLILFPTTGEKIWKEILNQVKKNFSKLPKTFLVQNMKDAVKLAYRHTRKGRICLMSCASTSFSIFKDYKEKGNLFKKYVKIYGKK